MLQPFDQAFKSNKTLVDAKCVLQQALRRIDLQLQL